MSLFTPGGITIISLTIERVRQTIWLSGDFSLRDRPPETRGPGCLSPTKLPMPLSPYSGGSCMTTDELFRRLQTMGNEVRRRHNTKAGAPANQFGVKLGDLRTIAKELKTNHPLGLELWQTGNLEAQLVATLIMKPQALSARELDQLTRSTTCTQVADWLNAYVVPQHPEQEPLRKQWMQAKDRWAARAGWNLTASRVKTDPATLDLPALLDRIDQELPGTLPEVQWTMNNTLAAIGIHHPTLRERVVAIGERIGLYQDWPTSKGCTPPYVPVWVAEMVKRQG